MATPSPRRILEKVRNETECCICTETYTDPRSLPCSHTFCLKCLVSIASPTKRYPGHGMPCPVCRQEFKIPLDGLSALQKNFFMERLVEMTAVRGATSAAKLEDLCEACLEGADPDSQALVPCAEMFCVDCRQKLCDECTAHHRKNKMSKLHNVVPSGSQASYVSKQSFVPQICEKHRKECLIFCENCEEVVCPLCFIEKHKFHNGLDVQERVIDFSTKVKDQVNALSEFIAETEKVQEILEDKMEELPSKVKLVKQKITERGQELKQVIDQEMKALFEQVDSLAQEQMRQLKTKSDEHEELNSEIESYRDYCSSVISVITAKEMSETLLNINETVNHLKERHQIQMKQSDSCPDILFTSEDCEVFSAGQKKILGRIETSWSVQRNTESKCEDENAAKERQTDKSNGEIAESSAEIVEKSKTKDTETVESACGNEASNDEGELGSYLSSPTFVQSIRTRASRQENHLINGIAVFYSTLFIIHEECSNFVCYDADTLSYIEELEVENMTDPRDIASSESSGCLYVVSKSNDLSDNYYIFKVTPSGFVDHKWCLGKNHGTLSLSQSGNVVVAFEERDSLKVYSADGRLVSELAISLSSDETGFYHAIEITQGTLLICSREGDKKSGICLVDMNSRIILKKYTDDGNTASDVRSPMYLAADLDGNVFVIDKFSRRVLLFSAEMTTMKEILTYRNRIRYAHKMEFDSRTGRLFIIDEFYNHRKDDYKDSRVLVFHVRR